MCCPAAMSNAIACCPATMQQHTAPARSSGSGDRAGTNAAAAAAAAEPAPALSSRQQQQRACAGLATKMREMRSRHSRDRCRLAGKLYLTLMMRCGGQGRGGEEAGEQLHDVAGRGDQGAKRSAAGQGGAGRMRQGKGYKT